MPGCPRPAAMPFLLVLCGCAGRIPPGHCSDTILTLVIHCCHSTQRRSHRHERVRSRHVGDKTRCSLRGKTHRQVCAQAGKIPRQAFCVRRRVQSCRCRWAEFAKLMGGESVKCLAPFPGSPAQPATTVLSVQCQEGMTDEEMAELVAVCDQLDQSEQEVANIATICKVLLNKDSLGHDTVKDTAKDISLVPYPTSEHLESLASAIVEAACVDADHAKLVADVVSWLDMTLPAKNSWMATRRVQSLFSDQAATTLECSSHEQCIAACDHDDAIREVNDYIRAEKKEAALNHVAFLGFLDRHNLVPEAMVEDQLLGLLDAKNQPHENENDLVLFCTLLRAVNSSFLKGHKRSCAVMDSAVLKAWADGKIHPRLRMIAKYQCLVRHGRLDLKDGPASDDCCVPEQPVMADVVSITPEHQPATETARPVNIRRGFNTPTVIARLEEENIHASKECSVLIEKTLQILKEPLRQVAKLPHEMYAMYGGSEREDNDDRIWTARTKEPQQRVNE
ncbi:hypothetical protein BC831DRAFT_437965 [Entophlyctis helioformis]|nr:hypothetical protein BC831DRAFT_437965 [Entophlyctis helioformis]